MNEFESLHMYPQKFCFGWAVLAHDFTLGVWRRAKSCKLFPCLVESDVLAAVDAKSRIRKRSRNTRQDGKTIQRGGAFPYKG